MFSFLNTVLFTVKLGVFENFVNDAGTKWGWGDTITVTLAGFFIVFMMLLLLIIIFTIFGKIMKKVNEREAKKESQMQTAVKPANTGDVDEETAAVITAAITEAVGGKKFIIKDIKEAKK